MDELQTYAALAEIFGALTILCGGAFAFFQVREFRKIRRYQVAADLCHQFSAPDMARAFKLVRQLPEDVTMAHLKTMEPEYEDSVLIVGMFMETLGLMVYQRIASYKTVQELAGGMVTMVWRKIGRWVTEWREVEDNPEFGEWLHWLSERIAESSNEEGPAYIVHANWNKKRG